MERRLGSTATAAQYQQDQPVRTGPAERQSAAVLHLLSSMHVRLARAERMRATRSVPFHAPSAR
jgi:hypothetical protein